MSTWTRKPQEREGSYMFAGKYYITRRVATALSMDEILAIYTDVQDCAQGKNGIDYLQVYTSDDGRKLYFIDNLNREMLESGEYDDRDDYCTLMFADEY